MKYFMFLSILFTGLISMAFNVTFNSKENSEIGYTDSGDVAFLQFGIEEVYLNDTKVIVMTEGMYRSITNKLNMLTYWCQKSYEGDLSTISGIEKWHGKKQRTIITNNTVYLEFADGYIHEDIGGKIDPKSRFENLRNRPKSTKPRNRTINKDIVNPITKKDGVRISNSKRLNKDIVIPNELKNIKNSRIKNVTSTNEVTIIYGPGRKIINEK